MIRTFLRRHASIFGTLTCVLVYALLLPDDWSLWSKLPVTIAVGIAVSELLSIKPAKRY